MLSGPEGRHAATVRRLSAGERADVTDGAGTVAECVVTGVRPGVVELAVLARRAEPRAEPQDRGGAGDSQGRPRGARRRDHDRGGRGRRGGLGRPSAAWPGWRGDRADKALARWRATAREAAKQSRRAWIPEVTGPGGHAGHRAPGRHGGLAVLLDPDAPAALGGIPLPVPGDIVVIVGPEGGVSPAEADALTAPER